MRHLRPSALLIATALLAGCGTSAQFQYAASVSGRGLAAEAEHYATRDAALDDAGRADRLAQVSALRAATATTQATTAQGVYAAWAPVRDWLRSYITADPRLAARSKADHVGRATKLDALIAAEAHRPFAATTRPAGS